MSDRPFIQSVGFGEKVVEITFMEQRDSGEQVALIRTCIFDPDLLAEEVDDVQEALASLLDEALVLLRLGGRKPVPQPVDEDDEDEKPEVGEPIPLEGF